MTKDLNISKLKVRKKKRLGDLVLPVGIYYDVLLFLEVS